MRTHRKREPPICRVSHKFLWNINLVVILLGSPLSRNFNHLRHRFSVSFFSIDQVSFDACSRLDFAMPCQPAPSKSRSVSFASKACTTTAATTDAAIPVSCPPTVGRIMCACRTSKIDLSARRAASGAQRSGNAFRDERAGVSGMSLAGFER